MVSLPPKKLVSLAHLVAYWSLFLSSLSAYASIRKQCTAENLLAEDKKYLQLLSNFLYPQESSRLLSDTQMSRPTILDGRSPGFYGGLLNLNVIGDYLISQSVFEQSSEHVDGREKGSQKREMKTTDHGTIKHGTDWKLVKRIWKDGKWWSSTPNANEIHLNTVYASFERKGYSIVIDKMQIYHPPLMIGMQSCCIKYICREIIFCVLLLNDSDQHA